MSGDSNSEQQWLKVEKPIQIRENKTVSIEITR